MLPITRANLQSFCRNCLREFTATETTHQIEQSIIQRNRLFPQKVCHCCYIKIKTLKGFQDRANLATGVLKLIVEERLIEKNDKTEIETLERRLKSFCRLCLKSNAKSIENCIDTQMSSDIKKCTGLQIENIQIKIEENPSPLDDDVRYSHSICVRCQTTLKGFVEYRQVAKQTIDYLQSIIDDDADEDDNDETIGSPGEKFEHNTEVESVEVSSSSFNSKFVVNVIENELNELLSEHEDVLYSDKTNEESLCYALLNKKVKKLNRKTRYNQKPTRAKRTREIENLKQKRDAQYANQVLEKIKPINKSTSDIFGRLPVATIESKQNEELQIEQNVEIEPCERLQNYKEETLFKAEMLEGLVKNEFNGNEDREDVVFEDQKIVNYNTNPEDLNTFANFVDIGMNMLSQESKRTGSAKQETDSESASDAPNENNYANYSSDSNSEDICLAELILTKEKIKPPVRKTETKFKRNEKNQKNANFKCEKCNKSFYKKHTIEAHLKRHEGASKAFACKQCDSSFTTYQALQRHTNSHDGKGTTLRSKRQQSAMRYKSTRECPKCHLVLKRHIDLADHIRKAHNGSYVFKCKICGKCLSTQTALNRHEQNHSDEKPFACQYCEKRYNCETELKVHMQRHTADPSLLCPICKTARANPEELHRHIAGHRKPHQCSKCGKVFTKADSLHQHDLSVHLNLRVHKCSQCDMSFKGRKTLSLHRLHHDPTGRPETCYVCGLHFRTKRGRLRHTSKFHPNAELPPEEPLPTAANDGRNECCEKCPLRFKTKRGLMLHTKKTHEKGQRISKTEDQLKEKYGDRSEVCELCQLQCYSKKGLSRHIRKSHPDLAKAKDLAKSVNRSEACAICPLKFRTARGLLLHTKRMHRDMNALLAPKKLSSGEDADQKLTLPLNWL